MVDKLQNTTNHTFVVVRTDRYGNERDIGSVYLTLEEAQNRCQWWLGEYEKQFPQRPKPYRVVKRIVAVTYEELSAQ